MKRVALSLMLAAADTAGIAHAQTEVYPARQLRLVASLAPGSSGDRLARKCFPAAPPHDHGHHY